MYQHMNKKILLAGLLVAALVLTGCLGPEGDALPEEGELPEDDFGDGGLPEEDGVDDGLPEDDGVPEDDGEPIP